MKKCNKCNKKAIDTLFYGENRKVKKILGIEFTTSIPSKLFCREHLVKEFKKYFINYEGRLVVYYPDLEGKKRTYQYAFFDLNKKKMPFQNKELNQKISLSLERIHGNCLKCDNKARVAYYPKGSYEWEIVGKWYQVKLDVALLENITIEPEILCLECAFDYIEQSLEKFKHGLSDGLSTPYGKKGMYFPTQI